MTLYDTQVINGEYYTQLSQRRIANTETVESGRGNILDSNGEVLVSNQAVYQVTLDTSLMGKPEERNDTILNLLDVAGAYQVEWPDTLPISAQKPFTFTENNPYYTVGKDEDGKTEYKLTQLGKLAVTMKWIRDPAKAHAAQPQAELGFFDKVMIKMGIKKAPSVPKETEEASALPTAEELLGLMCESFSIHGEGSVDPDTLAEGETLPTLNLGDLSPTRARALAGVLYELNLRSKGVYTTGYIFAQDVSTEFITRVKEQKLAGVEIDSVAVRQYHTKAAAHLLGRVGLMSAEEWSDYKAQGYQMNDTVGKDGVELAFESYLRGVPGERTVDRNLDGKIVNSEWTLAPEPGSNVVLTLDLGLQEKVEQTLAAHLPRLKSREVQGAACVILDVNNGGILASASYPTYDISTYSADYEENAKNSLKPLYNRAFQGTYAPGSTFKMVTAIAGLEEGVVTPTTIIRDMGRYTYYTDDGPMCWIYRQNHRTHGDQNVSQAIMNSCNYYFFDVGRRLGIRTLIDYANRFGLGQKTGLELYESQGVMASPEYTESLGGTWYDGNTLSVAIGQESSQFTPIQLANYIATLVNGGTRYETHLLKQVKSNDYSKVLYAQEPKVLSTIDIGVENLAAVKRGMLALTTEGSVAGYFRDVGVQVGAKTGSAQISAQTESNAVFVCFAPYDDPKVAMAIVVEHGGSGSELGAIAADVLKYYFSNQDTDAESDVLTEGNLIM